MKIKGFKRESLDKVISLFYQEHKEVIDVWQELMIASQTDVEINSPTDTPVPVQEDSTTKKK